MQLRLPDDLKRRFTESCAKAGIKQSEAMRQLSEAAVQYIDMLDGKWWPPRIEPADAPGKGGPVLVYGANIGHVARVAETDAKGYGHKPARSRH